METNNELGFETLAVHAGVTPDPSNGAIMTPIFATSTFVQKSPGEFQGYDYSRAGNPTRTALEGCLAALEGAKDGVAYGSGCAATTAILLGLKSGDHVLCGDDVYGGTFRIFCSSGPQRAATEKTAISNRRSLKLTRRMRLALFLTAALSLPSVGR